eukprot:3909858-Pleurochrysis_carterae.AAC.1
MIYESALYNSLLVVEARDSLVQLLGTLIDDPSYRHKSVKQAFTNGTSVARGIIATIRQNMRRMDPQRARSYIRGQDVVSSLRGILVSSKQARLDASCPEWLPTYMGSGATSNVCKANDQHPVAYKVTHEIEAAVHAHAEYLLLSSLSHKNIVSLAAPREFVMFYKTETPICSLADLKHDFFHGENGKEFLEVLWWDLLRAVLFLQTWDQDLPSASLAHEEDVKIVVLRFITPRVIGMYAQANANGACFKLNDFRFALIKH